MTRRLRLVKAADGPDHAGSTPRGLETAAALLEARAARSPRVLISDALAREVAGALRHLATLTRLTNHG